MDQSANFTIDESQGDFACLQRGVTRHDGFAVCVGHPREPAL